MQRDVGRLGSPAGGAPTCDNWTLNYTMINDSGHGSSTPPPVKAATPTSFGDPNLARLAP